MSGKNYKTHVSTGSKWKDTIFATGGGVRRCRPPTSWHVHDVASFKNCSVKVTKPNECFTTSHLTSRVSGSTGKHFHLPMLITWWPTSTRYRGRNRLTSWRAPLLPLAWALMIVHEKYSGSHLPKIFAQTQSHWHSSVSCVMLMFLSQMLLINVNHQWQYEYSMLPFLLVPFLGDNLVTFKNKVRISLSLDIPK